MNEKCVFCRKEGSGRIYTKYKKFVCDVCIKEEYELFKTHHYVRKVTEITDKIEKILDDNLEEFKEK